MNNNFTLKEVVIVVSLVILLLVLLFSMVQIKTGEKASIVSCTSNLMQIGLALRMYEEDGNKIYPTREGRKGFEMLRSGGYLENTRMYTCPATNDDIPTGTDLSSASVSYMYVPGLKSKDPMEIPVARDNEFRDGVHMYYSIGIRFTNVSLMNTRSSMRRCGNVLFVDGHASHCYESEWSEIIIKNNFTY